MAASDSMYWLKNAAYLAGLPAYAGLFRALASRTKTDSERLRLARQFRFRGFSLRPYQVDQEILELLSEFRRHELRRLVEIGTAQGGTLFLMLNAVPRTARVVSVDLLRGPFGGGYAHWKIPLFQAMAWRRAHLTLLQGSSQTEQMRARVEQALGGPADFILIDGDHSYEGARRDFELYRKIVAPGGMIAFHDIVPGPEGKVGGVPKLWGELKRQFRHKEFVRDWNQGGFGIGLLCL